VKNVIFQACLQSLIGARPAFMGVWSFLLYNLVFDVVVLLSFEVVSGLGINISKSELVSLRQLIMPMGL